MWASPKAPPPSRATPMVGRLGGARSSASAARAYAGSKRRAARTRDGQRRMRLGADDDLQVRVEVALVDVHRAGFADDLLSRLQVDFQVVVAGRDLDGEAAGDVGVG